ncbi:MAG: nitronate monooxygenase [Deltaproteobacteria bacterium]|nr:nitronate monooxygenase [Deltaproteobacteria bacterium]
MKTGLCKALGIEYPIFAFTHCRDVVAAVTNAGAFGVLGAVGFDPDQLEVELNWIDERVGEKPYGIDVIIPNKYEGLGERDPLKLKAMLSAAIPRSHREFADEILDGLGIPDLPDSDEDHDGLYMTEATSAPQIDVALRHPKVRLIANALGTPPPEVVRQIQDSGRMVGALCGSPRHAVKHVEAGLDFIIAQGGEGGGHTGEIGSVVLWPEVVDIAGDIPVIAAGGIGSGRQMHAALALGAQGVWCGSIWLTVAEAATVPAELQSLLDAGTNDTVRSRSFTGKHVRMLRNEWTDAWEREGAPSPLSSPLQMMLAGRSLARVDRYPDQGQAVALTPVGQIVGRMKQRFRARQQVMALVDEYLETNERLNELLSEENS